MNSFGARRSLRVGDRELEIFALDALDARGLPVGRLPYSLRVLLENLLRNEDGRNVTPDHVEALARWDAKAEPDRELTFLPARVVLQDFTGVPCVVDLAAMRDAMAAMGGDPKKINPLQPVELVIDHSVQVDAFGTSDAFRVNVEREFERNRERYAFLRWGQSAFDDFQVVPPGTGIVHQVNLEYLGRVVMAGEGARGASGLPQAYFDTLVGTDSHTTMINGLGVLGWGVGGIEAEAAMLGQPVAMLVPRVVGVKISGRLREGATATDLVLRVTELLRKHGVVGKFVEFFGPGLAQLPLADRATISNMCPEYGATCAMFPVDAETLRYLRLSGRSDEHVALVEAYLKEQGVFHDASTPEATYSERLDLDLETIEPSLAGPRRPQDRVALSAAKQSFASALPELSKGAAAAAAVDAELDGESFALRHGSVVIAAITSCTNTSNPSVMLAAGLVAKKAVEKGLETPAWVKTSLAPGSQVVTGYLKAAGLLPYLEQLRFHLVGYGCTTCIGNSGPLPDPVQEAIDRGQLVVVSVLSGNRNFEARVHPAVRANYLMSPPLVVAYALAGRMDVDLVTEPLGAGRDGQPVYLRDVWPTSAEIAEVVERHVGSGLFRSTYADVFRGDDLWRALPVPQGERFAWEPASTYVRRPPYFDGMPREAPSHVAEIEGARVLAWLGDSVTTDHISPAGNIGKETPAELYLLGQGVAKRDFNSYGSRRGNHEVMVRGTFANVRLRNQLAPGTEGGVTVHLPSGAAMSIFDASERYRKEGVPLVILAGQEYGSGSSRDWAAKGPALLGVRAVIAQSYERIHRSNLVGMGVLPLEFVPGESAASLGLTGKERYDVLGLRVAIASGFADGRALTVRATSDDGRVREFRVRARIDTPTEVEYYRHGGILLYVLRSLLG
ncbi:MAG: aconitate hydratase AcnA [Proteobacteria bacterium]|nr:MAG: aconitate hydratase AcnA [Pseudomonadota bacterium]